MEVDGGDALRHDDPVGVRSREEDELAALLSECAAGTRSTRCAVGGDDAATVDDPAELVPESCRRLHGENRVPATECLQVGAVGESQLHLDEHVARSWLGPRNLLDAQVAGRVQARGLHGVNATFSDAPER